MFNCNPGLLRRNEKEIMIRQKRKLLVNPRPDKPGKAFLFHGRFSLFEYNRPLLYFLVPHS